MYSERFADTKGIIYLSLSTAILCVHEFTCNLNRDGYSTIRWTPDFLDVLRSQIVSSPIKFFLSVVLLNNGQKRLIGDDSSIIA